MNSGSHAEDDRLQTVWDNLTNIVGRQNAVFPAENDRFGDYLHDETYLRGSASLVIRPPTQAHLREIIAEVRAQRAANPTRSKHLALTLRGGGSGLSGACVPDGGIVLDMTGLNRIVDVDENNRSIRAEAGVLLSELNRNLEGSALHYAVDPSSAAICSLGGSIATNAAGPSALRYGTTRQNLASVRMLTAQGEYVNAGALPRKASLGFSLPDLLCGSEGRLGVITEATMRLVPRPEARALVVAAFNLEEEAAAYVGRLLVAGLEPACIEILDAFSAGLVDFPPGCPPGGALLIVEFHGYRNELDSVLARLAALPGAADLISARDESGCAAFWSRRRQISPEIKKRFPFRLGEDIAVPVTALPQAMQFARHDARSVRVETAIWGHAGDGNLHVNYLLESEERLPAVYLLMQNLAHEVTRLGGAMSGEHGLGRLKLPIARTVLSREYFAVQSRLKNAFDPEHLLNPALDAEGY